MIHLSSVLFVYFLLYFEQKNYVKQYNNIQYEVYLTIPKSKKTHLKTGFWKLEFMEQQAEIAAKRRQITGRFVLSLSGQALHAKSLGFKHPTNDKWVNFDSKLPNDFKKLLDLLNNLNS